MNKVRLLVDLCEVIMGQSPDSSTYNQGNHGLPFYQGSADFGEIHPITRIWCSKPKKIAEKDDILISVRAPIGDLNIASEKCCIGRGVASIRAKDKNNYDMGYLFYFLRSQVKHLRKQGNGSTFAAINKGALANLHIPLIGYADQKKIVEVLDAIVCSIEKKKRQIEDLNNLVKSRFMEMFPNWDLSLQKPGWAQLGTLTKIYTGTTPKTDQMDFWGGDIPWVTPAELNSDSYIVSDTERHITEAGRVSKSLSLMPVGTVLLSTRAPIGKVAICGTPMTCNQGFKNFECGNKLNPTFLYVLLKLNVEWLQSQGTGTTFKEISKTKAGGIKIHVPSIESQTKFESFYKLIDKSRFIVQSQIKDLQELLDSKMDEYFGGDEG